jgi:hypothetical protein
MNRWPLKKALVAGLIAGPLLSPLAEAESPPVAETNAGSTQWSIKLPPDEPVAYRGVASFDGAGTGPGGLLYPAPSAGGFLAAVITHGLLVDSAKKEQKNQIQITADKVLLPYRPVLDAFSSRELMQRAVAKTATGANARLIDDSADHSRETVVESAPVFSLTQDQTAIILDNALVIRMPGNPPSGGYRNTVRVVSTPQEATDPEAFWTGNNGEKIKEESARLLAASLDIAFRNVAAGAGTDTTPFQTIRYREGSAEKIERAQVLSSHCGQLLVRNLRGSLMLVPSSKPAEAETPADQCTPATLSAGLSTDHH